jgi:Leucine Rich repeats (2 copies)
VCYLIILAHIEICFVNAFAGYISLYQNKFDGMIPRLFLKSNNRFFVDLSRNELAGTLPKNAASSNLRHLYLSNNQLWGSIPRSYSLMDLENLYLDHNQFTGHIPSDFSKKFLRTLQIQSNLFPADAIDDNICELDAFRDGLLIDLNADCYLCHCPSRLCEKCS